MLYNIHIYVYNKFSTVNENELQKLLIILYVNKIIDMIILILISI